MTESNGYAKETLCKAGTVAVIPAYNEERFIGSVVIKACKYADAVIVVDDGKSLRTWRCTCDCWELLSPSYFG